MIVYQPRWLGLGYTKHDVYFIFSNVNDDADSRTCHILFLGAPILESYLFQ